MNHTDSVLLKQWVHEHDAEAFRQLTLRHAAMVYNAACRILRNKQEAEEVSQECFEKLALAGNRPGNYLAPWLYRVTTNLAYNRLLAQRRRHLREAAYSEKLYVDSDSIYQDLYAHVDRAIADLPDKLRYPIVAHFLENQTHEAIAEALGVSRQTVTYRINQAMEKVRTALKKHGVTITAALFAEFLAAHNGMAAPASLSAALGKIALAGAAGKSLGIFSAVQGGLWFKTAAITISTAIALCGIGACSYPFIKEKWRTPSIASTASLPLSHAPKNEISKTSPATYFRSSPKNHDLLTSGQDWLLPAELVGKKGMSALNWDAYDKVVNTLNAPVSMEFENIALQEVLDFVSDSYDLNIILDARTMKAEPAGAATYFTDGMIPHIDTRNASMGTALRALCRPLGLDFTVTAGVIWISTPAAIMEKGETGLMDADDTSDSLLGTKTSIAFDNCHLSEITGFMSNTHELNIVLDNRFIQPPAMKAPLSEDTPAVENTSPSPLTLSYLQLKDVSLYTALDHLLTPFDLAYSVENGFLWISTPEEIAEYPFEAIETMALDTSLKDALETPHDFSFNEVSLADALCSIEETSGAAIRIDTRVAANMADTIAHFTMKDMPAAVTLNALLQQHALSFAPKDGALIVTDRRYRNSPIALQNTTPVSRSATAAAGKK